MVRKLIAIVSGLLAGVLLSTAVGVGLNHRFPVERDSLEWSIVLWGEHWFLRALVSLLSAAWAGFVAGIIGREKGSILGVIALLPSWTLWIIVEYVALTGYGEAYASIGNKLSMGVIILAMLPVAAFSGEIGEKQGQVYSTHFDSRPYSLLGIKWYHYIWLPVLLYGIIVQASYAGLYFLTWVKFVWQSGYDPIETGFSGIVTGMLYATLWLNAFGVGQSYRILAGFEEIHPKTRVAVKVLQYALGYQIVATILQYLIEAVLHYYFLADSAKCE